MTNYILPLIHGSLDGDKLKELFKQIIQLIPQSKSHTLYILLSTPANLSDCELNLPTVYDAIRSAQDTPIEFQYYVVFPKVFKTAIHFDTLLKVKGLEIPHDLQNVTAEIELQLPSGGFGSRSSCQINNEQQKSENHDNVDLIEGQFKTTAIGGTFDHLHDGHKILLTISAYLASQTLIVGVTVDALLVNKKYKEVLQPYEKRCESVRNLVKLIKPELPLDIYELSDICGPTATVEEIDALILSSETASGGEFINNKRKEKGWHELKVIEVSVVGGGTKNDGWKDKLSSTNFRKIEYERLHQAHH